MLMRKLKIVADGPEKLDLDTDESEPYETSLKIICSTRRPGKLSRLFPILRTTPARKGTRTISISKSAGRPTTVAVLRSYQARYSTAQGGMD